jgi:hypothetical protein
MQQQYYLDNKYAQLQSLNNFVDADVLINRTHPVMMYKIHLVHVRFVGSTTNTTYTFFNLQNTLLMC